MYCVLFQKLFQKSYNITYQRMWGRMATFWPSAFVQSIQVKYLPIMDHLPARYGMVCNIIYFITIRVKYSGLAKFHHSLFDIEKVSAQHQYMIHWPTFFIHELIFLILLEKTLKSIKKQNITEGNILILNCPSRNCIECSRSTTRPSA